MTLALGTPNEPQLVLVQGNYYRIPPNPPLKWRDDRDEAKDKPHGWEQPDFQAVLVEKSRLLCDRLSTQIRNAYDHLVPTEALNAISRIWENLDRTSQLAEARSRLVLGKLEIPPMVESPPWLLDQLGELSASDSELAAANPLAIDAGQKLIRACLLCVTASVTAEVRRAPMGHVFVDWDVAPNVLQWVVVPAALPWPGLKVNVVAMNTSKPKPEIQSRIFHNAFDAIEYFQRQLGDFGIIDPSVSR